MTISEMTVNGKKYKYPGPGVLTVVKGQRVWQVFGPQGFGVMLEIKRYRWWHQLIWWYVPTRTYLFAEVKDN